MNGINDIVVSIVKSVIPQVALDILYNMYTIFKKVIVVFGIVGYVLNVYHLYTLKAITEITGVLIVKVAGVFIPCIGAVMGYL
jgi:hypothetical protein